MTASVLLYFLCSFIAADTNVAAHRCILGLNEASSLLLRTTLHLILTGIPCFAACAWLISKGFRNILFLGLVALSVPAASGYVAFWLWFLSPRIGRPYSLLLPIVSVVILLGVVRKLDAPGKELLKSLLIPAGLTGALALLVLSLGFMHGGMKDPSFTAGTRFLGFLPPDNVLPYMFAEGLRKDQVPKPLFIDWRSSDRPPLQAGIVLSQYGYLYAPTELGYTILCVILQSQWVFALWLLLRSFEVDAKAAMLAVAVSTFSGFVFLNSFYVWPKLLAATYSLALAAIFLPRESAVSHRRNNVSIAVAGGALAAFGMLAHGASAFAILGLILTVAALRRRVAYKNFLVIIFTAGALYLPWVLYQRLYDPPGDRLLKTHLAGVADLDKRPLVQMVTKAYRDLGFRQTMNFKLANAKTLAAHTGGYWQAMLELVRCIGSHNSKRDVSVPADRLRGWIFFYFTPNMGALFLGPFAVLAGISKRQRSPEWRTAAIFWLYVVLTTTVWCLLMFGPGTTVIHQGTYVTVLLAFAGSILAMWALSPWLALGVGSIQILINLLLYVVFLGKPKGDDTVLQAPVRYATLMLLLASVVWLCFLMRKLIIGFPASRECV